MKSRKLLKIIRFPLILLLALIFNSFSVFSQDQTAKASAPAVVKEGNAFNYVISTEQQGQASLNPPPGIRIIGGPSQMVSYRSSNVNGRLENVTQITYTFALMPEKAGDYVIPPAVIKSGRKDILTNQVSIKVVENIAADNSQSSEPEGVMLSLQSSKKSIYEGEQIVIETKVLVRDRLQITSFPKRSYEGFWAEELEGDNFARTEVLNGYQYRTQVISRDLITAQKKGDLTIGPVQMDVNIQKAVRRSRNNVFDDFFDDPFFESPFQSYENIARTIKSNTLKINVKSLPAGAPQSFNGAVGSFKTNAAISKDSVDVNEAISINITISGKGNLGLISAPKLDFPPDLEVFEPKKTSKLNHDQNGTSGNVSFEYLIIPRHGGHYRIAPLDFSFFNPATGKYDRYISGEFEFFVFGAEVTAENGSTVQTGFFREGVKNLNTDIIFIKTSSPKYFVKGMFLVNQKWLYLVFISGLLLLIASYIFWNKKISKESDIFYVRNKKAWKHAAKRLKKAKSLLEKNDDRIFDEILRAVNGYLSDRLAMNTSDFSRETIQNELLKREIDEGLIKGLWELLDDCEIARYSPGSSVNKQHVYDNAVRSLTEIEQKI